MRDGRRLTVHLLPGDPHALLLEEDVATFRTDALDRLGLTPGETEVLRVAAAMEDEADIAWELFLSLRAARERLARLEAKLGVHTAAEGRRPGAARERLDLGETRTGQPASVSRDGADPRRGGHHSPRLRASRLRSRAICLGSVRLRNSPRLSSSRTAPR